MAKGRIARIRRAKLIVVVIALGREIGRSVIVVVISRAPGFVISRIISRLVKARRDEFFANQVRLTRAVRNVLDGHLTALKADAIGRVIRAIMASISSQVFADRR